MDLVCQPVCRPVSQAPLPGLDVVDGEEPDVDVLTVAGPVVGALELVVPDELVDVVGAVPLPVVGVVVPDWSSAVTGSEVPVGVVVDVPLVVLVGSSEPSDVPVPPVVDDVPVPLVVPVVVFDGDCAGSVMWPAGVCWR
jgi:hypothetical protein